MKTYWGNGGMTTHIKLGVRDKWSASRPCGFTPGIHWRGGGVGPCRETKAGRPTRSLVTILTELLQLRSAEGRGVKATLHAFWMAESGQLHASAALSAGNKLGTWVDPESVCTWWKRV